MSEKPLQQQEEGLRQPTVLVNLSEEVPFQGFREQVVMGLARKLPALPFSMLVHLRFQRRLRFFRNPKSFFELVVHKKLYDHDPLLTKTADKFAVREYVASKVGEHYLIPLQQVVDRPEDIDFDALHGLVVMKATHGCNMTMVMDAHSPVDRDAVAKVANGWLSKSWYPVWKEWAYRDITPRLVLEDFIGIGGVPPADIKFHVFNGRVGMIQVDADRFTEHNCTMLTHDWRRLKVGVDLRGEAGAPEKPEKLDEMVRVAETLGQAFTYARVDLYNVDGRIYVGEISHYPGAASIAFNPHSFDDAIGELWRNGTPIPDRYIEKTFELDSAQEINRGELCRNLAWRTCASTTTFSDGAQSTPSQSKSQSSSSSRKSSSIA